MRFIDKETIEKEIPDSINKIQWSESCEDPNDYCLTLWKDNDYSVWDAYDIAVKFLGEFPEVALYVEGGIALFDSVDDYDVWIKQS